MTLKEELNKLREIRNSAAPNAMERYIALSDEITARYTSPEEIKEISAFLMEGYKEIGSELEELNLEVENAVLKQQIAPYMDIIPLGYIAKKYFGKSTSWLSQRINGNKVRGRVYTLSEQDKQIFNNAIRDICKKLGSLSIA